MRAEKAGLKALKGNTKLARKPRKQANGPGISASEYFGKPAGKTNKNKTELMKPKGSTKTDLAKGQPKTAVEEYFGAGAGRTDAHKQDLKAGARPVPEYFAGATPNDAAIVNNPRRR